jgi:hypothetical protein
MNLAGPQPDVSAAMSELGCTSPVVEPDNAEYGAVLCRSGAGPVRLRVAKVTPTKVGLFVTVWQRAADGSTRPFPSDDGVDLLVVVVRQGERVGRFAFSKTALVEHGIVSVDGGGGKRGFRVYPPWSQTSNPQARRTQAWQGRYFAALHS